jgi:hypothetical protein
MKTVPGGAGYPAGHLGPRGRATALPEERTAGRSGSACNRFVTVSLGRLLPVVCRNGQFAAAAPLCPGGPPGPSRPAWFPPAGPHSRAVRVPWARPPRTVPYSCPPARITCAIAALCRSGIRIRRLTADNAANTHVNPDLSTSRRPRADPAGLFKNPVSRKKIRMNVQNWQWCVRQGCNNVVDFPFVVTRPPKTRGNLPRRGKLPR